MCDIPWFNIVTILFSIIAISISWRSSQTGRKALKQSDLAFRAANRPWLTGYVKSFDDCFIETNKKGDALEFIIVMVIKNKGKSPATKIHIPNSGKYISDIQGTLTCDLSEDLVLAPDDQFSVKLKGQLHPKDGMTAEDIYEEQFKEDNFKIDMLVRIFYGNTYDESEKHETVLVREVRYKECFTRAGGYIK